MSEQVSGFAAVQAKTGVLVELALQRLWLTGDVLAAGARLSVVHEFRSAEKTPVEVIYSFMLPRDAALRKFRIHGEDFDVESTLQETAEAEAAYEKGIEQGSLSALARQYRDGVINLNVGNVRPQETVSVTLEIIAGAELHDDGFRFRFPFTLAPRYHRNARAAEIDGVGEMELPRAEFGDVILPKYLRDASQLHAVAFDLRVLAGSVQEVGSPSHALRVKQETNATRVLLSGERDVPDRDLVIDVAYHEPGVQVLSGPDDGKRRFVAVIPSTAFGEPRPGARSVAIVLDRSGSMKGLAMDRAKAAVKACLSALGPEDRFGIIAFDHSTETFEKGLVTAGRNERQRAEEYLNRVYARGGTELASAVSAAAALGDVKDLFLVTDGQVAGTEDILAVVRRTGLRVHCLGIGSASQDRFLASLVRETGGHGRFLTPDERVDMAVLELFSSVGNPIASNLTVRDAYVDPKPPEAVLKGTPVVLFGQSEGRLRIEGTHGVLEIEIPEGEPAVAGTVRLLQGARLITDLENRLLSGDREQRRVEAALRKLGRDYGLANRELPLVAVLKRKDDRPDQIPKTIVVPVGVPRHLDFETYTGRDVSRIAKATLMQTASARPESFMKLFSSPPMAPSEPPAASSIEDRLVELAARLEPDGGMPGTSADNRVAASVAALLAFLRYQKDTGSKTFGLHIDRLIRFLETAPVSQSRRELVDRVLDAARRGEPFAGEWVEMASAPERVWGHVLNC